MDFELGEEEQAIRDLTAQVLDDMSSHERLKALAADGDHVDRKAWAALAGTGVVGASVPETYGGLGLGFLATAVALEAVGRRASPVPLLTTAVMGAMPIAAYGTESQRAAWLPGIADGSMLACAALAEDGTSPAEPTTTARIATDRDGAAPDGDDFSARRRWRSARRRRFSARRRWRSARRRRFSARRRWRSARRRRFSARRRWRSARRRRFSAGSRGFGP